MDRAKIRLTEAHRANVFTEQAVTWKRSKMFRNYLAELRAVAAAGDEDANRWIEWCAKYVENNDPLNNPVGMPEDPDPTPEALQPFLDGWSAYGPDITSSGWR